MLTRDLIRNLCSKLGHDDAATTIIKKVVAENLLDKVDDLRYVPRSRLEHWEVPLKLVDEMFDFVIDTEATALASGASAWVNYSFRPALNQYLTGPIGSTFELLRDQALKKKDPETWAVKRLQRFFRRRMREKSKQRDELLMSKALRGYDTRGDFRRLKDEDNEARRRNRAEARIRRVVRAWVERRRAQKKTSRADGFEPRGSVKGGSMDSIEAGNGLAASFVRMSGGKVKDCDVSKLLFGVCRKLKLEDEEVLNYFHKLITQNWIEDIDDLDLVDDQHWEAWRFPEKIVILLKQELREHQMNNSVSATDVALNVRDGVRDMASVVSSWLFGAEDDSDGGASHGHEKKDVIVEKDIAVRRSSAKCSAKRASSEKPTRTRRL
jgi:hypothetical protein